MSDVAPVLARLDEKLDEAVDRLFELLTIPSISTDPAHDDDCRRAGQWCTDALSGLGFEASLRDTPGKPMVVAHYRGDGAGERPHVLFYGHYDVQPVDPLDLWLRPPFEPARIVGDDGVERLHARGAADDKGQLMTFVEACRAWINTTGDLPLDVTVLLEGEEESGSPSLDPFLKANRDELSCDVALVCDTNMWDETTPAITTRLRGLDHDEVVVTGPRIDLHSGLFGGAAVNPIHVLTRILADLHDDRGRVAIPGFYDGVSEPPAATLEQWRSFTAEGERLLADIGLKHPAGEADRSVFEQIWSRPTAEINGIIAGYTGPGTKTVIPSKASAKLSFRLVGNQDPAAVRRNFRHFVRERLPDDCQVEFIATHDGSPAIEIAETNPHLQIAAAALTEEFTRPPVMMGCGGSIPIVASFRHILGMDSLLIGFGLNDDAIHSPNEKYNLSSFHRGMRSWARVIDALARA